MSPLRGGGLRETYSERTRWESQEKGWLPEHSDSDTDSVGTAVDSRL